LSKLPYNASAERMIISCLLEHGSDAFYDIDEVVKETDFYLPENRIIYSIVSNLITEKHLERPTISDVCAIIEHKHPKLYEEYEVFEYLNALNFDKVNTDNVKLFCATVAKLSLSRKLREQLLDAANNLSNIDGTESILQIIAKAEDPIIKFTHNLITETAVSKVGDDFNLYIDNIVENSKHNKSRGVPSGFPKWDSVIGGGLRKPGVHIIGGRSKSGKSFISLKIGSNVASLKIPVLYLDTELTKEITYGRLMAMNTGVKIDDIETGLFLQDSDKSSRVKKFSESIDEFPLYYYNISGKKHQEWISIIRRWIMKNVGFNEFGEINDCLVILDYLKLMNLDDTGKFQEYQYLGQMITDLHNVCVHYNIPMLAMAQLNRDGINNNDQSAVAGSDRLVHLCSSLSYIRQKTAEDFADDPSFNGDRKMAVIASRFGPGLNQGEYINLITDLSIGKIQEGNFNTENRSAGRHPTSDEDVIEI